MHPAAELLDHAKHLIGAGRREEARPFLEAAFSMALMEQAAIPAACKVRTADQLPLASPAHVLAHVARGYVILYFRDGVELTPAMSLAMFGMVARLLSNLAARLPDTAAREIIFNFSDGCEVEGDYRRVSFSCSRPDSVLIPDYLFANSANYASLRGDPAPWRDRRDTVFWRGAASGRPVSGAKAPWGWHQRLDLCHHARHSAHAGRLDIAITDHLAILDESDKRRVEAAGFLGLPAPKQEFTRYRYLIDVDGFSNSWGFLEKLMMGAAVVKVGSAFGYRQWYYERLEPWVHYAPVAADLSDFDTVLSRLFADPAEAERIAATGRAFALSLDPERELAEAERRVGEALRPAEPPATPPAR